MADVPDKFLVEFLAMWVRDEDFRCRLLFREIDELAAAGFSAEQSFELRQLDKDDIMKRLVRELEESLGIDLDKVQAEVSGTGGANGRDGLAAGLLWDQGTTHVRGVEPTAATKHMDVILIARGHGWDGTVSLVVVEQQEIPGSDPTAYEDTSNEVECELLNLGCDVDVYQRATLKVKFPNEGVWRVKAICPTNKTVDHPEYGDSPEPVYVTVS